MLDDGNYIAYWAVFKLDSYLYNLASIIVKEPLTVSGCDITTLYYYSQLM